MKPEEIQAIRKDWKIDNPDLAVNEQQTINRLLDEIERLRGALEDLTAAASKVCLISEHTEYMVSPKGVECVTVAESDWDELYGALADLMEPDNDEYDEESLALAGDTNE